MTVSFTVEGAEEVNLALGNLSKALDTTEVLDEASAMILARIRARFLQETDPEGKKWAPLAPYTIFLRLKKGFAATPILFVTGNLFHSIQLSADGPSSRVISTDVGYAAELQTGRTSPTFMPARRFLGVNQEDADLVTSLIVKRVKEALS